MSKSKVKHAHGVCSSCGAKILWIETPGVLGPHPVQPKRHRIVTDDGTTVGGHESHFAYCPNALKHRKSTRSLSL